MTSLAQYSTALHDAPATERPAPGTGTRIAGVMIYLAAAALVVAAAVQSAAG